jgi:Tfp pilus assembly protein PilN
VRRTRIDFAEPSLRRMVFGTPMPVLAAALLALVLCGVAAWLGWRYTRQLDGYRAQLAMVAARAPVVVPVAAHQPRVTEAEAASINAAILQLNLPWQTLRDAIQAATSPSVALLSLEPNARKRSLRLTAEARDADEMVAYVEQLQRQPGFSSVALTRHEINDQDPNHPIRFQIEAQWRTNE